MTVRFVWSICLLSLLSCGDDADPAEGGSSPVKTVSLRPVGRVEADRMPPPDDDEQLARAHHLVTVSGDLEQARKILRGIVARATARRTLRAQACFRLSDLAQMTGHRRDAVVHLEHVESIVGPEHPLADQANDRRARILTATPLANVRGPVPGSIVLRNEPPQVVARFRRAEQLLARFHRVVVAPKFETINEVLRTKRHALAVAVAAYQKTGTGANGPAKAASQFRIGAMYHHLAEALVFAIPPEALPTVARQLRRQLKGESAAYLRKALGFYQAAARVPLGPGTSPWRQLAGREAKTLGKNLKSGPGKPRSK